VRGAVRLRRKETGLALEDFRRARAGEPALYAAAVGLAQALAAQKEWDTALPAYQEAALVAVTPWQRAEAQAGRAEALYRLGRQPEAREALDEVRASDPGMAESLSRRLFPKVP
jgi:tetratricopeptide (TPR) repeat protein